MFRSWDSIILENNGKEAKIDVTPYTSDVTMAIISESGFGIKLNNLFTKKHSEESQVNEMMHNVTNNLMYYIMIPNWFYLFPIKRIRAIKG